jgi:thymidylate kinase
VEGIYLLLKKILKRGFPSERFDKVRALFQANPQEMEEYLKRFWRPGDAAQILSALTQAHPIAENDLDRFARSTILKVATDDLTNPLLYWFKELARLLGRIRKPSGLVLVLLGPDGAGKSTLAKNLMVSVTSAFRHGVTFHWRPGLLPMLGRLVGKESPGSVAEPHGRSTHGRLLSVVVMLYYWVDFLVGYWVRIFPSKVRSTFIVFDRYFPDFLVDPVRYRLQLQPRFVMILYHFLPKPDVVLALLPDVVTIQERKKELTSEELSNQSERLQNLISDLPNGVSVTEKLDEGEMGRLVEEIVCDRLHRRFVERYLQDARR